MLINSVQNQTCKCTILEKKNIAQNTNNHLFLRLLKQMIDVSAAGAATLGNDRTD